MRDPVLVTAAVGGVLGLLVAWAFRLYIRHGKYKRVPTKGPDPPDDWYETPAWLRLPVVISSGFAAGCLVVLGLRAVFSGLLPDLLPDAMGPLSLVLALALYLVERSDSARTWRERRRATYAVAFGLGVALALLFVSVLSSARN